MSIGDPTQRQQGQWQQRENGKQQVRRQNMSTEASFSLGGVLGEQNGQSDAPLQQQPVVRSSMQPFAQEQSELQDERAQLSLDISSLGGGSGSRPSLAHQPRLRATEMVVPVQDFGIFLNPEGDKPVAGPKVPSAQKRPGRGSLRNFDPFVSEVPSVSSSALVKAQAKENTKRRSSTGGVELASSLVNRVRDQLITKYGSVEAAFKVMDKESMLRKEKLEQARARSPMLARQFAQQVKPSSHVPQLDGLEVGKMQEVTSGDPIKVQPKRKLT
ncbi:unnamed protein product [Polarella glacialis]|uniref:Uncharacterized protein n=1 Tax=Polarella glacialis TaxID=89957 RepID=A0A813KUL7_POLGL|nr:unnamed protein product [Polarella glacialis]